MTSLCREVARTVSGNGRQKCHARNEGQRSREASPRRKRRWRHTKFNAVVPFGLGGLGNILHSWRAWSQTPLVPAMHLLHHKSQRSPSRRRSPAPACLSFYEPCLSRRDARLVGDDCRMKCEKG